MWMLSMYSNFCKPGILVYFFKPVLDPWLLHVIHRLGLAEFIKSSKLAKISIATNFHHCKLLLYPWIVAFIHRLVMAALLRWQNSVKNANLANFLQVWELLQVQMCCMVCPSKVLINLNSYGTSMHGTFLPSVGNVRMCNLNITYCVFIAQNSLIPPKYYEQNWK